MSEHPLTGEIHPARLSVRDALVQIRSDKPIEITVNGQGVWLKPEDTEQIRQAVERLLSDYEVTEL